MNVLLTTLNAKYIHSSLALRNLRAYCRSAVSEILVREYTINNTLLDILADIYSLKADVIGFACYIWNIDMTLKLADLIKKVKPDVKLILGGPEVSYEPLDILQNCESIDYIVQGEGEKTLNQLLTALQNKDSLISISGLSYRQENGRIVEGSPQVIEKLDSVPFSYDRTDMDNLADRIVYYESSRGCPYSCQYCLSSATTGVRYYSLERVLHDLKFFVDYNVRQVKFVDRTFNANKKHYLPILKFLASQKCRTNFHFEIAADILDDEVLEFLETVPKGRFQFEIGIQSTYEPTLKEIRRQNNWPQIVKTVSQIQSYKNIHMHLDLIIGLPYENIERFAESFNDVFKLKPDMLQIGFLKLLKGSGIRKRTQSHEYIYMDIPPYEVLATKYMSYKEIRELKLLEDIFNQLYNSGRFKYTVNFLIENKFNCNAFEFFRTVTANWEKNGLHMTAQSPQSLFKFLKLFVESIYCGQELKVCLDLLKFDALLSGRGNIRPDFLPWNGEKWNQEKSAFWRNEAIVSRYIPGFLFSTWREIKNNYHIEVFETAFPNYFNFFPDNKCRTVILFDYTKAEPEYSQLNSEDFGAIGGQTNAL